MIPFGGTFDDEKDEEFTDLIVPGNEYINSSEKVNARVLSLHDLLNAILKLRVQDQKWENWRIGGKTVRRGRSQGDRAHSEAIQLVTQIGARLLC